MKAHEVATRINPDYAEAYMSLAMLCATATRETQRAQRLTRCACDPLCMYWGQGALHEAERLLKHSIRSRPMAEAAANLGIVQSDLGNTQEALAAFRQVHDAPPACAPVPAAAAF